MNDQFHSKNNAIGASKAGLIRTADEEVIQDSTVKKPESHYSKQSDRRAIARVIHSDNTKPTTQKPESNQKMITKANIFRVDFNEMIDFETIMFSQHDEKTNIHGTIITIAEGMIVILIEEDFDQSGNLDNVIATGTITKNDNNDFSSHVKWCCKIDTNGIRHESELTNKK